MVCHCPNISERRSVDFVSNFERVNTTTRSARSINSKPTKPLGIGHQSDRSDRGIKTETEKPCLIHISPSIGILKKAAVLDSSKEMHIGHFSFPQERDVFSFSNEPKKSSWFQSWNITNKSTVVKYNFGAGIVMSGQCLNNLRVKIQNKSLITTTRKIWWPFPLWFKKNYIFFEKNIKLKIKSWRTCSFSWITFLIYAEHRFRRVGFRMILSVPNHRRKRMNPEDGPPIVINGPRWQTSRPERW